MALFDLLISPRGLALDRHLVRYTGYSFINWVFARKAGVDTQPALLLRSQGKQTGLWRDAALPWFYDRGNRVVVGSNGGQASDPQWVHNLRAHPEAEIFVNRTLQMVRARFLEGEEHQRVWDNITSNVPVYIDYQRSCKGHRQIPLVVLEMV